jgi:shikimate dehydrogenase
MKNNNKKHQDTTDDKKPLPSPSETADPTETVKEIGGPKGPEPTRYGDWEKRGRCIDF